ncbi:MAG: UDP-N-acetylmuramoyl-L-alanyl-D-glutamate--2,6-diaminopimelate ligase [Spirochaetae bacterium HGW-Spirochaetae-7]|jgi:UDP-N-acetylmuramoyl-L-alanyl-D-glutamate--2,6-diaminopimelate ligase|nr:MAG: UDP-N-acetylmuramoyl-L-alanyl-D-glutamate--2,6-diaminopimelate ligase [Spirochaetae bacterium HGW-Spirochaetae-7]
MTKRLNEILPPGCIASVEGDGGVGIAGLAYDSRDVRPGWLFFALQGLHTDGHDHIDAAIRAGAVAVLHDKPVDSPVPGVSYVRVADARATMSPVAAAFNDRPSSRMAVVGVTGTEGKSTTVWLIYRLLDLAGRKAGFVSTVEYRVGDAVEANPKHQTTPEATTVHEHLARMVSSGFEYAVVESSSHGLSTRTGRLADVAFDVGVMTNVRHEHLEFHGTWERYRDDKANLFRALDAADHRKTIGGRAMVVSSFGVACADDPSARYFAEACSKPVYTYSAGDASADLYASDAVIDERGANFVIHDGPSSHPARIELPGAFNIENSLAAILVVSRLASIPLAELVPLLPRLDPVNGRMTRVDRGQPFEVIIDYAHTPSSFEAILPSIKGRIRGKLLCVFGSGGERDVQKRPAQGRVAAEYCDVVILADEDPRGEVPMALLEDIAAGCGRLSRGEDLFLIPDRAEAIRKAFSLAAPGDAVLLLGKGHENTIDYASGAIPWNELDEANKALAQIGYRQSAGNAGKGAS